MVEFSRFAVHNRNRRNVRPGAIRNRSQSGPGKLSQDGLLSSFALITHIPRNLLP